jgi:putative phosphoesterase
MRIGLISDIHCHVDAFEVALEELAGQVDEILVAGDSIYEYRISNDTVDLLRESGVRSIAGNHELVFMGPGGVRARQADYVRQADLDFLGELPMRIETNVGGGKKLLMVHGSPWEPYSDYVVKNSAVLRRCGELDADFLVLGHTHMPLVERVGSTLVINPGSLGESRVPTPERPVSYAILDTDSEEVDLVSFAPPPRRA